MGKTDFSIQDYASESVNQRIKEGRKLVYDDLIIENEIDIGDETKEMLKKFKFQTVANDFNLKAKMPILVSASQEQNPVTPLAGHAMVPVLLKIAELQDDKYLDKIKKSFYKKARNYLEYLFPIRSNTEDDEEFFYNITKIIALLNVTDSSISHKIDKKLYRFCNVAIDMYKSIVLDNGVREFVLDYINGDDVKHDINHDIDITVQHYLIKYIGFCRLSLGKSYKEYKSEKDCDDMFDNITYIEDMDVFNFAQLYTIIMNHIYYGATEIANKKRVSFQVEHMIEDDERRIQEAVEEKEMEISQLSEKLKKEKEHVQAYKKAFETCNLGNIEDDGKETVVDDETERKIQRLDAVILELERENKKLGDKLVKAVEENKALQEEIKLILPEETTMTEKELEVDIEDVDYEAKYAFIIQNNQPLELEKEIKSAFPNSVIVRDTKAINSSIDLAVFLTRFLSHSLYSSAKRTCKDLNIPYIHCSNMNIDKLKQGIWSYYNS